MEYSIDYLSWSIPCEAIGRTNTHLMGQYAEQIVSDFLGAKIHAVLDNQPFTVLSGRAPYGASWGRADGGVRIFGSPTLPHILIEITGTGCKTLRTHQALEDILSLVAERASRLDLAVDIQTSTAPHQFAANRDIERFKTITDWRSETGDTFYVGSMKSDRYARVYRFASPHPRHAQLRVEHVFRRAAAKVAAKEILEGGYPGVVRAAGAIFGWTHQDWQPAQVQAAKLTTCQVRKTEKNTVRWLYGSVVTAAAKAVQRGDLDLEDWFNAIRQEVQNGRKERIS